MKTHYVAFDVHAAMIVSVVLNGAGKLLQRAVIPTGAESVRAHLKQFRGKIYLTFEEGALASWLYEVVRGVVTEVVVCDPRRNKLLESGSKTDKIDAGKLAELLRIGSLRSVYHGDKKVRTLKELVRNYDCLVSDTTRVKNRLKAIFRARAIACGGHEVYRRDQQEGWLEQLQERGARRRAESLYAQLEALKPLRQEAKREMIKEARRQPAYRVLISMPHFGPVGVAQLMAVVGTPFRFRNKRLFWTYIGLAVVTRTSADYLLINGMVRRTTRPVATRGLNRNHNHVLKRVFKTAATAACVRGPFKAGYQARVAAGMAPSLVRLTVARQMASTILSMWKRNELFAAERMKAQVA